MAVFKTFPIQDTTLYSSYPEMNSGLDAICEISNILDIAGSPCVTRYLTLFDNSELTDIINNKIQNKSYSVFLKNSIALAEGINADVSVEVRPIAQHWNNGTGHFLDSPQIKDGAGWNSPTYSGSASWSISGSVSGYSYTGSTNLSYSSIGGGNWFTTGSFLSTQSFGLRSDKNLSLDVSNVVNSWYSGSIPNYGFITKLSSSYEFNNSTYAQPILKYYSVDTNTIYPPYLEFRWDDYNTVLNSPLSSSIVTDSLVKVGLSENGGIFHPDSVNRFRVNVSPLYPTRTFQTSSLFTNINYLPTSSYYAIKDLGTNEYIVDFDPNYTKISSDVNGNYFDVYMSGLEPNRFYCILIKTTINNSTLILDNNYYFKVNN